jgi:hypothetical protein
LRRTLGACAGNGILRCRGLQLGAFFLVGFFLLSTPTLHCMSLLLSAKISDVHVLHSGELSDNDHHCHS